MKPNFHLKVIFFSLSLACKAQDPAIAQSYHIARTALQDRFALNRSIDIKFKNVIVATISAIIDQVSDFVDELINSEDIAPEIKNILIMEVRNVKKVLSSIPEITNTQNIASLNPQEIFMQAWFNTFGTELNEEEDLPYLIGFLSGIGSVLQIADRDWYSRLMEIVYGSEGQEILLKNFKQWLTIFTNKLANKPTNNHDVKITIDIPINISLS